MKKRKTMFVCIYSVNHVQPDGSIPAPAGFTEDLRSLNHTPKRLRGQKNSREEKPACIFPAARKNNRRACIGECLLANALTYILLWCQLFNMPADFTFPWTETGVQYGRYAAYAQRIRQSPADCVRMIMLPPGFFNHCTSTSNPDGYLKEK